MPEDFHARSLLSVKSVKSPKTCRPVADETPLPRVCNGMSFLRIGGVGGRINDKRGGEV